MNSFSFTRSKLDLIAGHFSRLFFCISDAHFRVFLCVVLGLWSGFHFYHQPDTPTLNSSYDNLVRNRIFSPSPDPDIVILDIDEASLAQMSEDFGRWPWPRDTLAATLAWLEYQGAKAVVFDILFADPDHLNRAADASFAEAVRQSKNSYFPVLRLNPQNDQVSEVKASQLPGFALKEREAAGDTTLAVVAPLFDAIMESRRLGFYNVYLDEDGVLRHYRYWEEKQGWRFLSLPARMALDFGWGLPTQREPLINWSSVSNGHTSISFFEVWKLSQSRLGQQSDSRFSGKIVIVGATAATLFDAKTTPVAKIHPGVEVLATAIDNAKNQRYLRQVPRWLELSLELFAVCLMFWVSQVFHEKKIKWATVVAPTFLMGLSFVSLHCGGWYLDLSVPASQGFVFFALLVAFRAKKQNYWSRYVVLGKRGLTQAWAINSATLTQHELIDLMLAGSVTLTSFCLQSLVWTRGSDRTEQALWIIRIAGETAENLVKEAEWVQASIKRLKSAGEVDNFISGTMEPFELLQKEFTLAERFEIWVGIESVSYPFLLHDEQLVTRFFSKGLPEDFCEIVQKK